MASPTVPAVEAMASAPMPTAAPRVPWDGTGEEQGGQYDNDPHPLLQFVSARLPVTHTTLLSPYAYDHCPNLLALPCRQPLSQRILHRLARRQHGSCSW